jgi:hypothetical protein
VTLPPAVLAWDLVMHQFAGDWMEERRYAASFVSVITNRGIGPLLQV